MSVLEGKIDYRMCKLSDLTPEEIDIVEEMRK
jgi:hypothetical protein